MEDSAIIDLYWAREERALTESDSKYGGMCRTIAFNILHDRWDSEECVNDTWLRAWNTMPPQRPGVLSAFLSRITRNLSLDRYKAARAAKRGGSQVEVALHELEGCLPDRRRPDEELEARETAALISAFLRAQPDLDRRLFVRRYFHLESIAALGRRFGLTESQIKSRLHRTRQKLKSALAKEGIPV